MAVSAHSSLGDWLDGAGRWPRQCCTASHRAGDVALPLRSVFMRGGVHLHVTIGEGRLVAGG